MENIKRFLSSIRPIYMSTLSKTAPGEILIFRAWFGKMKCVHVVSLNE